METATISELFELLFAFVHFFAAVHGFSLGFKM